MKINVGSKIEFARRGQRIRVSMPADGLEGLSDARFHGTVVDHQGGAAAIRDAPADLHRLSVATPFEDRARARGTELRRQQSLKKRKWFRRYRESKLIVGVDLNPTLVPAAVRLYCLVDRQRMKECIDKSNRWPGRPAGEPGVPEKRHARTFQCFCLLGLQHRANFDQ